MKKVLITATVQSHICQFHKPLVEMLHSKGFEVHVAAKNNLAEKNGLTLDFVDKVYDVPFSRSPKSFDNIKAYKMVKNIIKNNSYDVIHCNTPMGGIVTRLAAKNARRKGAKVIYTAHGFHFYQYGPKKSWLIYYPIEKLMARYTDTLITITQEDYKLAKERGFCCDVKYIHGVGVDNKKYLSVSKEANEQFIKDNGYDKYFTILCTGELNKNKNQKTVIYAVEKLKEKFPNVLLLLAGNGPEENNLRALIENLNLCDTVKLLGYRTDLEVYANACDMVVSASYREGLPLNIMEAMVCGKPIVASINRGHRELIENGKTGFLVSPEDVDGFASRIEQLMTDEKLRQEITDNAKKFVFDYTSNAVAKELETIYFI